MILEHALEQQSLNAAHNHQQPQVLNIPTRFSIMAEAFMNNNITRRNNSLSRGRFIYDKRFEEITSYKDDVQPKPTPTGSPASIITTSISTTLGEEAANVEQKTFSVAARSQCASKGAFGRGRRPAALCFITQHSFIITYFVSYITNFIQSLYFCFPTLITKRLRHAFHIYFCRCPSWQCRAGASCQGT